MLVDDQLLDVIRHGFSLIWPAFGSFSLFQGLTIGERHVSPLPKTFALIVTAIGVIVILLALLHTGRMTTWVNADAFGDRASPPLPEERHMMRFAIGAVVIGVVSFIALLLLP